jgi:hypothetical protein
LHPRPLLATGRAQLPIARHSRRHCLMNFVSPVPQSAIVTITPDIAKQLLATSPGNRPIRPHYVRLLSIAMKRGDWLVTSQGIGIDTEGRLRDAHHRLHAGILADTTFQSTVVWGLSEDAYQVTDRGLSRSYSDILDCPKPVAEVLRLAGTLIVNNTRPTVREIRPLIDRGFKDVIEALISFCPSKVSYFSCAPFKLAAAVQIINDVDADFIYSQYRALVMARYDEMTVASKALTRRVTTGTPLRANDKIDVFARALVVFNPAKSRVSKIVVEPQTRITAMEYIRESLDKFVSSPVAV